MDPNNLPGSMQLSPESTFSEDLLSTAESYGLFLSTLLDQAQGDATRESRNITVMADSICESVG